MLALPESDVAIRMPIPSANLEMGATSAS